MDEKPPNSVNKVLVLKRIKRFKIYPEENKEFKKSKKEKPASFQKPCETLKDVNRVGSALKISHSKTIESIVCKAYPPEHR